MNICFIGNNANGGLVTDGGRIKMRNIMLELEKLGNKISVVDLYNWKIRFISILNNIKKSLKNNDVIIIMAGPKGSRVVINRVAKLNHKYNKKIVFIPVGLGTIDTVVKELDSNQLHRFINSIDFYNLKDDKIKQNLNELDMVIPENSILCDLYKNYYELNNVSLLRNFRNCITIDRKYERTNNSLKIVYMSRIAENKGIFDLINAVNRLRQENKDIRLDVYGDIQLSNPNLFHDCLNEFIAYKGVCDPSESIDILSKYDLLCLPTKYYAEGTPGVVVESFFAGTPCLISSYSQVNSLIQDKITGITYSFCDFEDLKSKLNEIYLNKYNLIEISKNVQSESKKYTIEYAKDIFIRIATPRNLK